MVRASISLVLGIFAALMPIKTIAAERISVNVTPFGQFYLEVNDLEAFVETGKISKELAYYLNRLPDKQVARLPELLSTAVEFEPLTIAKFANSTVGETVIKNFGKGIRTSSNRNGFLALRSAIIAATFEDRELTVINLLRQFPGKTIYIDLQVIEKYIERGQKLLRNREAIDTVIFGDSIEDSKVDRAKHDYLAQRGKFNWREQTLSYSNPRRSRTGNFDLYLPDKKHPSLIVISHGVASSRKTFTYLGRHLASQGFAVAIVEHNDISLNKFDNFLSGLDDFPEPNNLIERPLDIKYVLDFLERESYVRSSAQNKINLERVGIIGHSFGGYSSLVLAGGKLIADPQEKKCSIEDNQSVLLDLSSLAKCTFNQVSTKDYQLKDSRVKAVIALNPMSRIFDPVGISSIDVPTMFVSSTNDLIMPPVAEQIQPFTWLDRDIDKYLVFVKPGTHFSFLREGLGVLPVPDSVVGISPTEAYPVIKALATVFFQTYLNQQEDYRAYLQSDALNLFDNSSFQLSIINSLDSPQLLELLEVIN